MLFNSKQHMIHYWYTVLKILALRKFQSSIALDESITRTFRVRLFEDDKKIIEDAQAPRNDEPVV